MVVKFVCSCERFSFVNDGDVVLIQGNKTQLVIIDLVLTDSHQRFYSFKENIRFSQVSSIKLTQGTISTDCRENVWIVGEGNIEDFLIMRNQLIDDGT